MHPVENVDTTIGCIVTELCSIATLQYTAQLEPLFDYSKLPPLFFRHISHESTSACHAHHKSLTVQKNAAQNTPLIPLVPSTVSIRTNYILEIMDWQLLLIENTQTNFSCPCLPPRSPRSKIVALTPTQDYDTFDPAACSSRQQSPCPAIGPIACAASRLRCGKLAVALDDAGMAKSAVGASRHQSIPTALPT